MGNETRKPAPVRFDGTDVAWIDGDRIELYFVWTTNPKKARRVGEWLIRAADYLESRHAIREARRGE